MLFTVLELERYLAVIKVNYLYQRQCFILATAVGILKDVIEDE